MATFRKTMATRESLTLPVKTTVSGSGVPAPTQDAWPQRNDADHDECYRHAVPDDHCGREGVVAADTGLDVGETHRRHAGQSGCQAGLEDGTATQHGDGNGPQCQATKGD